MVTVFDGRTHPTPVAWTPVYAPGARVELSEASAKAECGAAVDRESAYETLAREIAAAPGCEPLPLLNAESPPSFVPPARSAAAAIGPDTARARSGTARSR